ncbi:MAG: 2,3-bisphosphoglycerate-independent phosphoglycerate mutase [Armatimonadota bacterium]|nr:2,3-bisphosphoglycerate-independent phosphoglycerate mutase [Armatimonadota bacterium]MDR5696293.1 2,3-bisphosphoglycerate-independent phosphoglycerate mutase [Armatimonadota bacterium]
MAKIVYVILDGLGDRPIAALGGRTPLEAAHKPNLDGLAARGRQGRVTTVGPGIAPESDVAVTAMLGYDPHPYHAGRGLLEALGMDVPFADGNLALRGNFATVGAGRQILDRRVGRDLTSAEAHELAEAVNRRVRLTGARFALRASVGHRCVVVFYDDHGPLSASIGNTDPAYARVGGLGVAAADFADEIQDCVPLDDSTQARRAAHLVNEFTRAARQALEDHPVNRRRRRQGKLPANAILLRDASDHVPAVPGIAQRFGLRMACFVEMPVERGIARMLGMGTVDVPPSGQDASVYAQWADRAVEALPEWDGLYIHLKGPDEAGHDGDWERKRHSIEGIDRHFFGKLLPSVLDAVVCVTADHATPCEVGRHTDDPVPLLVSGPGVEPDGAGPFGEGSAPRGSLGDLRGIDVLPLLAKLAGRG